MKKLWLLPLLPLALVACGPRGTDPVSVDPLTLSFIGTGTVDMSEVSKPISGTLIATNGVTAYDVGTLAADGKVSIAITADQAKKLASPIKSIFSSNCDVSGVTFVDNGGSVYEHFDAEFKGNPDVSVAPDVRINTVGDARNVAFDEFWYSTTNATVKGTLKCPSRTQAVNLELKPGWNHVVESFTRSESTNQTSNHALNTIDYSNTYNGVWGLYTRSN